MRTIHKGAAAAFAGSALALFATASPAFAGTITNPTTSPFPVPESTGASGQPPAGTPLPFEIQGSGYGAHQNIDVEICDGTPSTANGWDPTINCDLATSPPPAGADASGNVTFAGTNANNSIGIFRGQSPSDDFNCLAPEDVPSGSVHNPDGSITLPSSDSQTANGEAVDPSVPAWTNCQLRMSSNDSASTSDQAFLALSIPDTPAQTPEAPFAVLLPLGAVGLLGGVVAFSRRRRAQRAAA